MQEGTNKITFAGVAVALASVCIILTNFLPLRITLLMITSVCYYLVFLKCGKVFGLLSIVASILISFFTSPFSSAFFLSILLFAPYSILAYFLRKLSYFKKKPALIRAGIIAVFASIVFLGIYLLLKYVSITIDFEILALIAKFSYPLLMLAFIIFAVGFDIVFTQVSSNLCRVLKIRKE